ncbi:hypothetical protein IV38_GL001657 [Lactobacillus selangorensis]|uniref:Fluoride-specific ion channel FluC n=1 Tax=Lactobacillus selangorensis TaxID=81857 RepID=A0A0R2FR02_9LACO|nr:fluoride efflux transporter CrcB [Lactobacillus selangorensis]KRN28203.1 hypothetical protein IV38_GL001657 [Lactobacillus selangorensis]KRN30921.1 hypothetical protein IV40_GL001558 [Lactobacillus selangorensis]
MTAVWVGLGAIIGALARVHLSSWLNRLWDYAFPLPTFLINLTGSFLLGLIWGAQLIPAQYAFLGTGVMGGYTTFSTFNRETVLLFHGRRKWVALAYNLSSYLLGILLAFCGWWVAQNR